MKKRVSSTAVIQIRDLALKAVIGIETREREEAQEVLINLTIEYNALEAARSDDIKDAVDYKAVEQAVVDLVGSSRFNLVERMAAEILKVVTVDPRVDFASVTIDKPQALSRSRSVALTMSIGTRK